MEILDIDKVQLKALWLLPKERQRIQMLLFQAIADSTDLSAKDVEAIINNLDGLLKEEEEEVTRRDPAR